MQKRQLGPFTVSAIGLGCMNLSHAYGTPPDPDTAATLLLRALELGYTHFDTAALYGFGANETLLGNVLKDHRAEFVLASKCGAFRDAQGKRELNGHPDVLKKTCDESLQRLQTDVIDLYYLHRWDKRVPIEDSVGALAQLVQAGKIRTIGLSEVSADTLRRAHHVHPITAVQSEYSLWTRNAEIKTLDVCSELGISFVAFSPLGRGFLTGTVRDPEILAPRDLRRQMPRFQGENFAANLGLLEAYADIAKENRCTPAQLALAWLLNRHDDILLIPGTTRIAHLEENLGALDIKLSPDTMRRLDLLINDRTIRGARYNEATQAEIDTEVA